MVIKTRKISNCHKSESCISEEGYEFPAKHIIIIDKPF